MSVQTFDPGTANTNVKLTMTTRAQQRAEKELAKHSAIGLRLTVKKSGCSGFRYLLDFVTAAQADDLPVAINDKVTLFVAPDCRTLVNGTEIDYVTEGLNSSFAFHNPNATGECGCGESFTVN